MRSKKGIEFLDFPQVDIDDILAFNHPALSTRRLLATLTEIPEVSKVRKLNQWWQIVCSRSSNFVNVFDKWRFAEFVFYQEGG